MHTHLRSDFRAPVSTLNCRANCRAEIPYANCSTDLFRTDLLAIAELIVRQSRNELAELSCVTARVVIVAACTFYVAASVI